MVTPNKDKRDIVAASESEKRFYDDISEILYTLCRELGWSHIRLESMGFVW